MGQLDIYTTPARFEEQHYSELGGQSPPRYLCVLGGFLKRCLSPSLSLNRKGSSSFTSLLQPPHCTHNHLKRLDNGGSLITLRPVLPSHQLSPTFNMILMEAASTTDPACQNSVTLPEDSNDCIYSSLCHPLSSPPYFLFFFAFVQSFRPGVASRPQCRDFICVFIANFTMTVPCVVS